MAQREDVIRRTVYVSDIDQQVAMFVALVSLMVLLKFFSSHKDQLKGFFMN